MQRAFVTFSVNGWTYDPNNKTYAVNNTDAELYYKMFPGTKPQLEETSIDDRLKSYAANITSLYDKDIDL